MNSIPKLGTGFNPETLLDRLSHKINNLRMMGRELHGACPHCGGGDDRFFSGPNSGFTTWYCRHNRSHTTSTASLLGIDAPMWITPARPSVAEYAPDVLDHRQVIENRQLYTLIAEFAHNALLQPNAHKPRQYLFDRGITFETILAKKLGFIDTQLFKQFVSTLDYETRARFEAAGLPKMGKGGETLIGGYKGKITFPYIDQAGNVTDIRTRSISDADKVRYMSVRKPKSERGATPFFGIDTIGDAARVVLTEGEFKHLVAFEHGIDCIAIEGTNAKFDHAIEALRGRYVILAFDNDTIGKNGLGAGEAATLNIGRKLKAAGIEIGIVPPSQLHGGIDDTILSHGIDYVNALIAPGATLTLAQYESELVDRGVDLSGFKQPKPDVGIRKIWTDSKHVDRQYHTEHGSVTIEEVPQLMQDAAHNHFANWRKGNSQLMMTATAGAGKTTSTVKAAFEIAEQTGETVAMMFPSHSTIDEKLNSDLIPDGVDVLHVHGRRNDDEVQNCTQAETALLLTQKGHSPGALLCPSCDDRHSCAVSGYKSQFEGKKHRAYSHGHAYSDYPAGEDLIVVDEFSHKSMVDSMQVWQGDIDNTLNNAAVGEGARDMLKALQRMYGEPNIGELNGCEFYEQLERFYPNMRNVNLWDGADEVQGAIFDLVQDALKANIFAVEEMPDAYGEKLFSMLADDVRLINAGRMPTGRVSLRQYQKSRSINLVFSKGMLPAWFAKRPSIILNATGDPQLMQDALGDLTVVAPVVAMPADVKITQDVTKNNTVSGLTGKDARKVAARVAWFKQIRLHMTDESDTLLVTAKALVHYLEDEFPKATVSYFLGLEGRNDLQRKTTIICNAPSVSMIAVQTEARALYKGIDATLTRSISSFDYSGADGKVLAVEQIDGMDPIVSKIMDQHRDAVIVQAIHRSRIVRNPDRELVILQSRPVPHIVPTEIITERDTGTKATAAKVDLLQRLVASADSLADERGGFTVKMLEAAAGASVNTVRKYWQDVTGKAELNYVEIKCAYTLKSGGIRSADLMVAMRPDIADSIKESGGGLFDAHISPLLPDGWSIDYEAMKISVPQIPSENVEITGDHVRYKDIITSVISSDLEIEYIPDNPTLTHIFDANILNTDAPPAGFEAGIVQRFEAGYVGYPIDDNEYTALWDEWDRLIAAGIEDGDWRLWVGQRIGQIRRQAVLL